MICEPPLSDMNVVLVTLDSCRYDSAVRAATPVLDALGPLRRAMTYGTFTLPAHVAFFSGFLPNVVDPPLLDYYSRERTQLWRLAKARARPSRDHLILLHGTDVVDGFRRLGYRTVGAGGVRWFAGGLLPALFDEFHYWAPEGDDVNPFASRRRGTLALQNIPRIVAAVTGHRRWFLFVNAAETHAPYTAGDDVVDDRLFEILDRGLPQWNGKTAHPAALGADDFAVLHAAQVHAVTAADTRLGELFDALPRPFVAAVCADHGEAFGEGGRWGHDFVDDSVLYVPMWVGFVT